MASDTCRLNEDQTRSRSDGRYSWRSGDVILHLHQFFFHQWKQTQGLSKYYGLWYSFENQFLVQRKSVWSRVVASGRSSYLGPVLLWIYLINENILWMLYKPVEHRRGSFSRLPTDSCVAVCCICVPLAPPAGRSDPRRRYWTGSCAGVWRSTVCLMCCSTSRLRWPTESWSRPCTTGSARLRSPRWGRRGAGLDEVGGLFYPKTNLIPPSLCRWPWRPTPRAVIVDGLGPVCTRWPHQDRSCNWPGDTFAFHTQFLKVFSSSCWKHNSWCLVNMWFSLFSLLAYLWAGQNSWKWPHWHRR